MLSAYGANELAKILTGQATMPASLWLALLTTLPDPADDGTDIAAYEPAALDGYVRYEIPLNSTTWTSPVTGSSSLTMTTIGYVPTADWPVLGSWALVTADIGGFVFMYDYLPTNYTVRSGFTVGVPANTLSIAVT